MANLQYSPFSEMSKTADEYSDGLKASIAYLRDQHAAMCAGIREKNAKRGRLIDVLRYVTSIVPELKTEIDDVCGTITMTPEPHAPSDEELIDALKAAYTSPKMLAPPEEPRPEPEFVDVRRIADIVSDFQPDMALQRPIPRTTTTRTEDTRRELEEYAVRYMNT